MKAQLSVLQRSQIVNTSLWHFKSCQFFHLFPGSLRARHLDGVRKSLALLGILRCRKTGEALDNTQKQSSLLYSSQTLFSVLYATVMCLCQSCNSLSASLALWINEKKSCRFLLLVGKSPDYYKIRSSAVSIVTTWCHQLRFHMTNHPHFQPRCFLRNHFTDKRKQKVLM